MEVESLAKNTKLNSGSHGKKNTHKSYLRQTNATRFRDWLERKDEGEEKLKLIIRFEG